MEKVNVKKEGFSNIIFLLRKKILTQGHTFIQIFLKVPHP